MGAALAAGSAAVLCWPLAAERAQPRAQFVFVNSAEVTSLDPHTAGGIPEQRVARALFEGLVERDPETLQPIPAAARSMGVSSDGLEFTFELRPEARWSNGDAVTARDFEAGFARLLDPATASTAAGLLDVVVGAKPYRTGRDELGRSLPRRWDTVWIRAVGERSLRLRLVHPYPQFLQVLANPQFVPVHVASLEALQRAEPRRWRQLWTSPGRLIGNGPFVLAGRRLNDRLRLTRNPHYWDRAQVGFETIDVLALESFSTALNMYLTGAVDWLDGSVPPLLVPRLVERADFRRRPYLGCYFYRVNTTQPPWNDARVRRALSLTIDRQTICTRLLGAGQRPLWDLVPWNMLPGSLYVEEYANAVLAAWELLTEAGYWGEGAKTLPALEIHFNSGEVQRDIAEAVASSWQRALKLETRLVNQEWKAYLHAQRTLEYDISRSSWIADLPDPLNFLEILESDSDNNRTGWSNATYDALLAAARRERDAERREQLLQEAAQILREEAPVLPIYAYVAQDLVHPRLEGFAANALNDQNPKRWRWRAQAALRPTPTQADQTPPAAPGETPGE